MTDSAGGTQERAEMNERIRQILGEHGRLNADASSLDEHADLYQDDRTRLALGKGTTAD